MNIRGIVESLVFRNTENGYTVLDLDSSGELITCVGYFPIISEGEEVELSGEFKMNSKYGRQFSVTAVKAKKPSNAEGIERYLSSGLIRGVGPVTANNIVKTFGMETLDIIEFHPSRLSEVKGVSGQKAKEIGLAFLEIKKMQGTIMFLQGYDISLNLAMKIFNFYGGRTEELLRQNPYRLVEDIDGVGFITADRFAGKLGVEFDSAFRIRAGIMHCIKESAEKNGNTFILRNFLEEQLYKLLQTDVSDRLVSVLESMAIENVVKLFEDNDLPAVALQKFYATEEAIAVRLSTLCITENEINFNVDADIAMFEKLNKIRFHKDQIDAIKTALFSGICVITGGPGTGKTTIIKCICSLLRNVGKTYLLLAPTGRATKRISESTGLDAKTIHRGLEVEPTGGRLTFKYNERNKLQQDAIIVDEVSMIDCMLMNNLLKAVRSGTKLILVGDRNQLPSVGAGNVLSDIIYSGVIPVSNLTQIYRQDENSKIIINAHAINNGEMPDLTNGSADFFFDKKETPEEIRDSVVTMTTTRISDYLKINNKNIQVLAPMKSGVSGVDNLNKELQEKINPPSLKKKEIVLEWTIFREGDRVMQTQNNYQMEWIKHTKFGDETGVGVFNGDIGEISDISRETGEVTVEFEDGRRAIYIRGDLGQLMLAYAVTVHKSQGCEFDVVIMPIVSGPHIIFTRNLLYTAVTRAKKAVILVGKKANISRMIRNNYTEKRFSMLCKFLKEKFTEIKNLYS